MSSKIARCSGENGRRRDLDAQIVARDVATRSGDSAPGPSPKKNRRASRSIRLGEGVARWFSSCDILRLGNFTQGASRALRMHDSRYLQLSAPFRPATPAGRCLISLQWWRRVGQTQCPERSLENGGDLPQNVNFALQIPQCSPLLHANRVILRSWRRTDKRTGSRRSRRIWRKRSAVCDLQIFGGRASATNFAKRPSQASRFAGGREARPGVGAGPAINEPRRFARWEPLR